MTLYPGDLPASDVDGWRTLYALLTERYTPPTGAACPNDGWPLQPAGETSWRCPFDGWTGTTAQTVPTGLVCAPLDAAAAFPATFAAAF